jgi:hypothetical protein
VNDAADDLLAGIRYGAVRRRSSDRYKPSAIRSYGTALELHARPDLGASRLGDLKGRHAQRLADRLVAAEHAPSTAHNALMPLRVIFRRALRDGLAAVSPCDGLELPRELPPARANRLDRRRGQAPLPLAVAVRPGAVGDSALRRRGELLALHWAGVDLPVGAIRVESAHDPKGGEYVEPKVATAQGRRGPRRSSDRSVSTGGAYGGFGDDRGGRQREGAFRVLGHASIVITLDLFGHLLPGSIAEAATARRQPTRRARRPPARRRPQQRRKKGAR